MKKNGEYIELPGSIRSVENGEGHIYIKQDFLPQSLPIKKIFKNGEVLIVIGPDFFKPSVDIELNNNGPDPLQSCIDNEPNDIEPKSVPQPQVIQAVPSDILKCLKPQNCWQSNFGSTTICSECGKTYKTEKLLKEHKQKVHDFN